MKKSYSYEEKWYNMTVTEGVDHLTVSKHGSSDWAAISMKVNDLPAISIGLRSKAMVEQLHFMLGQMLSNE